MKLSIIVVSWNVREELVGCIRSIEENRPFAEFEIIVVDNASSDGTVDAIKHNFSGVTVIANKENRGFAAANNQGIRESQGQYILLLNPDTIVHPHSLRVLVDFLDANEDVGVCGPKLLYGDGTIQPSTRRFPSFRAALHRHTAFRFLRIFTGEYNRWLMKDFDYDRRMSVDEVTGAALMVRRSVIDDVGGMDESFFMYYEEVDLCYRIKQAGWHIVFVPEAVITHLGGRAAGQIPVRSRVIALTSLLTFFRKHRGRFITAVFKCVFKPAIIVKYIYDLLSNTIAYIFATITFREAKRRVSVAKVRNAALLLSKYCWQLLFRI